jgi:hypothetical protein
MGVKTLKVTDNDFVLSGGRLETLTGLDALAQLTENRLKLWFGEWFLAPDNGIDYLGLFNNRTFLKERYSRAVRRQVLSDSRIKRIITFNVEYDNSSRTISATLNLESTEGIFTVTI